MKKEKTQSQVGRMSRSKGASYENVVAKILSLWWTGGTNNKAFRRTPMSGGWDSRFAAGDLIAPEPNFPIHIEIRKRETFELGQLLKGGDILNWLVEGESKCPAGQDLWYIMSRNRDKNYLFMRDLAWSKHLSKVWTGKFAGCGDEISPAPKLTIKLCEGFGIEWAVMRLSHFLAALTPDQFRQSYDMEIVQRIKHRSTK